MKRSLTALALLCVITSCARDHDPCPPGSVKSEAEDLCRKIPRDAGDPNTPAGDASTDAQPPAESDGSAPNSPDASHSDSGPKPSECSTEDVDAWRMFQLSDQATTAIGECFAGDPSCATSSCPLDACLRKKAGVEGCESCVQDQVECVAARCRGPCGSSGSDSECRACACAKGCVEAFDACAGSALDVCADCQGSTCTGMSVLSPALIMVIVAPVLSGMMP